jgi:hypothetical protein
MFGWAAALANMVTSLCVNLDSTFFLTPEVQALLQAQRRINAQGQLYRK